VKMLIQAKAVIKKPEGQLEQHGTLRMRKE
jgi:hypothetical protein